MRGATTSSFSCRARASGKGRRAPGGSGGGARGGRREQKEVRRLAGLEGEAGGLLEAERGGAVGDIFMAGQRHLVTGHVRTCGFRGTGPASRGARRLRRTSRSRPAFRRGSACASRRRTAGFATGRTGKAIPPCR